MAVLVALLSAAFYAAAMVLQQHDARKADPSKALHPGLLVDLARRPQWLAGVAANGAAYALRYVALGRASLALVEPILATSLLFALPVSAFWDRHKLRWTEWAGALSIVVGLATFLLAARPEQGETSASGPAWLVAAVVVVAVVVTLVGLSRGRSDDVRARLLAAAGGTLFTLAAALTKAVAAAPGVLPSPTGWEVYALLGAFAAGVVLIQSAFNAGPLRASLPVLMVVETVGSVVVGATLFGEVVGGGAGNLAAEVVGMLLMTVGIVMAAGTGRSVDVANRA